MSFVALRKNVHATLVPPAPPSPGALFFENCENAAGFIYVAFAGSSNAGARDVPLMPSLPGIFRGSGRPASWASVGNMSTICPNAKQ